MGIRRSAEDTAVDTLMRITQSSTNKEESLAAVRALAKHAVTNETALIP